MMRDKLKEIQKRTLDLEGEQFKTVKQDVNFLLGYIVNLHKTHNDLKDPTVETSAMDKELAKEWIAYVKKKMPWISCAVGIYAQNITKVRQSRNINDQGMKHVFEFIKTHKFWGQICVTPGSLLKYKQGEELAKIDYILADFKKQCGGSESEVETVQSIQVGSWDNPFK